MNIYIKLHNLNIFNLWQMQSPRRHLKLGIQYLSCFVYIRVPYKFTYDESNNFLFNAFLMLLF